MTDVSTSAYPVLTEVDTSAYLVLAEMEASRGATHSKRQWPSCRAYRTAAGFSDLKPSSSSRELSGNQHFVCGGICYRYPGFGLPK